MCQPRDRVNEWDLGLWAIAIGFEGKLQPVFLGRNFIFLCGTGYSCEQFALSLLITFTTSLADPLALFNEKLSTEGAGKTYE